MENEATAPGEIITGYKATNKNMCCHGFQFELGKWYEHDGPLEMCKSGFHFCEYPSGPSNYYGGANKRLFRVEAEITIKGNDPGATLKHVCKKIRLTKEITPGTVNNSGNKNDKATKNDITTKDIKEQDPEYLSVCVHNVGHDNSGSYNTGNRNTGSHNTGNFNAGILNKGDCNTGTRNFGDSNTGNRNTGDYNTGEMNAGIGNVGDNNTGDLNSGHWNKGIKNTGNNNIGSHNAGFYNKGNCNTGDVNFGSQNSGDYNDGNINSGSYNTGNMNTGTGNAGDNHSGCLNYGKPKFYIFNEQANPERVNFELVYYLSALLKLDTPINPEIFLSLPNATPEKIQALHEAHKKLRAKQAKEQQKED